MPADRLGPEECVALGHLVDLVDRRRVRLYRRPDGAAGLLRTIVLRVSGNRAVALGHHVFLPDGCAHDLPVLAHELTHCAQYHAWGAPRYYARGALAQVKHLLHCTLGIGVSPYSYSADPVRPFSSYGMEQQGQIVEDCFRGRPEAETLSPFRPGISSRS
jgi:Domain of unknown function (DUF4157)